MSQWGSGSVRLLCSPCTAQDALAVILAELLLIEGGTHRPSITSALGAYSRIVRLKSPIGAGSQLDSISLLGESCGK